jgi:hypothetical protein
MTDSVNKKGNSEQETVWGQGRNRIWYNNPSHSICLTLFWPEIGTRETVSTAEICYLTTCLHMRARPVQIAYGVWVLVL